MTEIRRVIVAGAPCAGKSTYVWEKTEPGDLVYDFDTLHQSLSGLNSHAHSEAIRPYVLAARDAVFAQLETHLQQPFLAITSSPKKTAVEALAARLSAEIVFLDVSLDEAHRRADIDSRPEVWHAYIDNWFSNSDFIPQEKGAEMEKIIKKTYKAAMEFKADGEPGEFRATFATLNVIDLDQDVTVPGAFEEGQEVIVEPWNHSWDLPAGKGAIHADDSKAWIDGVFFLDTEAGRENYRTVKNLGSLAQWSYTFKVESASHGEFESQDVQFLEKLDTIGVSPVTRGAGLETRTELIKSSRINPAEDENEGESETGKPSDDLLARIDLVEANLIILGVENE